MDWLVISGIILGVAALCLIIVLVASYICFRLAFYKKRRKPLREGYSDKIPNDDAFEPFRADMLRWIEEMKSLPQKEVEIRSFDGLRLRGRFFEFEKGAPIEILLHGYRSNSERDLSGGIARCFALGRSVMLVDHRACGRSEGNMITFGIHESRDCADWVKYIIDNIDPDARIFIGGVSMGAATAMLATARDLPDNVVGILADCGYSSAKKIIKKVIKQMHLPADICYPFVKLGARIYGHFDLEEISPEKAMAKCTLPVFFVHGDADDFVPYEMSEECYNACTSKNKYLLKMEGAGHGLAFPLNQERYIREVADFYEKALSDQYPKVVEPHSLSAYIFDVFGRASP